LRLIRRSTNREPGADGELSIQAGFGAEQPTPPHA
jgi:hypothetical protein